MKLFFILLLLFFLYPAQQVFSQIKPGASLELGYEDKIIKLNDDAGNAYASSWLRNKEFADIHLNAGYKRISVYTDVKTSFNSDTFYEYNPIQAEYKLGINYHIKRFLFNVEHSCSHSIETKAVSYSYDKFSVKIKLF
jgi:hypothetical protein